MHQGELFLLLAASPKIYVMTLYKKSGTSISSKLIPGLGLSQESDHTKQAID